MSECYGSMLRAQREREEDQAHARADAIEAAEGEVFNAVCDAVRDALLLGVDGAQVPGPTSAGPLRLMPLREITFEPAEGELLLLRLLAAAARGDVAGAAAAAEEIISAVAHAHAEFTVGRLSFLNEDEA